MSPNLYVILGTIDISPISYNASLHSQQKKPMKLLLPLLTVFFLSPALRASCFDESSSAEQNFKTCHIAAERGEADAQKILGNFYAAGKGVPQNYQQALHWFTQAAEQGHVVAIYNIGVLHDKGLGVKKDYHEARKWYRQSSDMGYSSAQYNLGIMYEYGQTVEEDHSRAMELYLEAAEQGEAAAQFAIGLMYDKGTGVAKDPTRAYMWWQIAGDGHPYAIHNRDSIAEEMTPMQVSEGKRLANAWLDARPGLVQLPSPELQ